MVQASHLLQAVLLPDLLQAVLLPHNDGCFLQLTNSLHTSVTQQVSFEIKSIKCMLFLPEKFRSALEREGLGDGGEAHTGHPGRHHLAHSPPLTCPHLGHILTTFSKCWDSNVYLLDLSLISNGKKFGVLFRLFQCVAHVTFTPLLLPQSHHLLTQQLPIPLLQVTIDAVSLSS